MLTSFTIYIRAVGLYALITLPAMFVPLIYLLSLLFVLIFGWFAWALFTVIYLFVTRSKLPYHLKMALLQAAVVPSVAFAYQMTGILTNDVHIWDSGGYLLFPVVAVIAGWISIPFSRTAISEASPEHTFSDADNL